MALLEDGPDVNHRVDVCVFRRVLPYGRVGRGGKKRAESVQARWCGYRMFCVGEREEPPPAVRLDDMAEVHRFGVGETDDRP